MSINVGKLELIIQQKISTTTSEIELMILAKALATLKTGAIFTVATFSQLPSAATYKGYLYFVEADTRLYWSTGTAWYTILQDYESTLWTWGTNVVGQLGDGTIAARNSPGTTAGGGFIWSSVSAGGCHTASIKTDGTLWTWGTNVVGQLGDGTVTARSSPGTIASGTNWSSVSSGLYHTAGIKTDGTLWTWGCNGNGRLGDGTAVDRSIPGTTAGGSTTWSIVSAGGYQTLAIKTDGTLWTWGSNGSGQLGDGTSTNRSSPGTTSGGGTNWSSVNSGQYHTAGIKTDGTLWTWGGNGCGQLGNSTITNRSSPGTTAGGGTNWSSVSSGLQFTAAIKTDGTLWTWGNNSFGILGDGTITNRSSPGTTTGGGTNWRSLAAGARHTAAIKTDGTLWTWGFNNAGPLGDGTITNRSSPGTTAGGGTNWSSVSGGGGGTSSHTAAIKKLVF
jgi:alpha-tubulin suppressor-like RCC1 family protein